MYRETHITLADLRAAASAACQTHEPLGAYATEQWVSYLFANRHEVVRITAERANPKTPLESLASDFPVFDWHEREMCDTHGVVLAGQPNDRSLLIGADGVVPPALSVEGKGVSVIVVGPVHAGIIEPGRFTFSTGGETVIYLDAQLSYSRRGVEPFLEGMPAVETAPRVARICAACTVARSWAYARALEHLSGVSCDERAEWARVVFAELERLYNHVFDLASSAAGAGYGYGQTHGLALKERVHELCAAASASRMLFDAIVPGGVRSGTLADPQQLRGRLAELRRDVAAYTEELFRNRSAVRRFEGTGYLSQEIARSFGAVGPARRASGGEIDIRSFLPYGAYAALAPEAQVESGGDAAARCRIKCRELTQSFELLDRALAELGDTGSGEPAVVRPGRGAVTTVTEGPRGTESVSIECDHRGALTRAHVISASYRNWPLVLRANEGNIVPDFPLVNKSFNLCYACVDR